MVSRFEKFSERARRVLSLAQEEEIIQRLTSVDDRLTSLENTMNNRFDSLESRMVKLEERLQDG